MAFITMPIDDSDIELLKKKLEGGNRPLQSEINFSCSFYLSDILLTDKKPFSTIYYIFSIHLSDFIIIPDTCESSFLSLHFLSFYLPPYLPTFRPPVCLIIGLSFLSTVQGKQCLAPVGAVIYL